jgi:hypothetical protein
VVSGAPRFEFTSVLPAKRRFLEWRDPDSNRGHHDFQTYSEAFRYAVNPYR